MSNDKLNLSLSIGALILIRRAIRQPKGLTQFDLTLFAKEYKEVDNIIVGLLAKDFDKHKKIREHGE